MPRFEIVNADVIEWTEGYDGPKFHACLCDPSYALSKKKAIDRNAPANLGADATIQDVIDAYHSIQQWGDTGFMGCPWDSDICFDPHTWAAVAGHLHPGAWMLAFASSRGHHRLAVAMEDAGLVYQPDVFVEGVGVVEASGLVLWATGQAFPKASKIDATLDRREFARREKLVREALAELGYTDVTWAE